MAKYNYIEVVQPVGGLMKNMPTTDIPDVCCTDCQNVYFENGELRKRFGYSASTAEYRDYVNIGIMDDYQHEIVAFHEMEWNIRVTSRAKYLYVVTTQDVFYQNITNNYWKCCTLSYALGDNKADWNDPDATSEAEDDLTTFAPSLGTKSVYINVEDAWVAPGILNHADTTHGTYTSRVRFWIKLTNAAGTAPLGSSYGAGELRFFVHTSVPTTTYWNLPTIPGDGNWRHIDLDLVGRLGDEFFGTDYHLTDYMGFYSTVDLGAHRIYIDGLHLDQCFGLTSTSTLTEATSVNTAITDWGGFNNVLMVTNLTGYHFVCFTTANGTSVLPNANDYNATRDEHRCRSIIGFASHCLLLGLHEQASEYLHLTKVRWSDLADVDIWNTGTSGTVYLPNANGEIVNAVNLYDNCYIFKTDGITKVTHLGGETAIFDWSNIYYGDNLIAPRLLLTKGNYIYWCGNENIYRFDGANNEPIGNAIKDDFIAGLNYSVWDATNLRMQPGYYHRRSHVFDIKTKNLMAFCVPTRSAFSDSSWVYDYLHGTWTYWKWEQDNITAGISYSGLTGNEFNFGTLFGTSTADIHDFEKFDEKNDDGHAITAYWDSKDFFRQDEAGPEQKTRWSGLYFDALGDSVSVYYMIDGNGTWTLAKTVSLTSIYKQYFVGWNQESNYLRIRFYNNSKDSTFRIRRFSVRYQTGATH